MFRTTGTAAPALAADAFVRGEQRRTLELAEFRGTWVVLAFGVRQADILELAELEEAFAADGAVVLAATGDGWQETEERYGAVRTLRFPILTEVEEHRRITAVIDPSGVVRHIGSHHSARETLAVFEAQLLRLAA